MHQTDILSILIFETYRDVRIFIIDNSVFDNCLACIFMTEARRLHVMFYILNLQSKSLGHNLSMHHGTAVCFKCMLYSILRFHFTFETNGEWVSENFHNSQCMFKW